MTTTQPRIADGTFTFKDYDSDNVALNSHQPSFLDEADDLTREAATVWAAANQWASETDFENKLFDTYISEAQYNEDLADEDSELNILRNQLRVYPLPSGGVGVFFD